MAVWAVAAALLLSGCSAEASGSGGPSAEPAIDGVSVGEGGGEMLERGEPQAGGTLRMGLAFPLESLNPAGMTSTSNMEIMRAVFDVLFTYDKDGNVVPELAESIQTVDEGLTWTMKLPSGVLFSDGTPFNSAAVVAHLNTIGAEGSRSQSATDIRAIESIDAPDADTVVFTLKAPLMTFPKLFTGANPGGPSMVPSPAAVASWGKDVGSHPVGAGPFMLESFRPGGDVVLVRNPTYRIKGLPYLDKLVYVTATDAQSRLSAVIAGDLDLANTQSAADLKLAADGGLVTLDQPQLSFHNIVFNLDKEPFNDVRFRKAVMQAVDLNAVNQAVYGGAHKIMTGVFPPQHPFYIDTGWPGFDPDSAKALVQEYTAETGVKPQFVLTSSSLTDNQRQAAIIQQMLTDVGITAELDVSDQPTMVTEALSGNYQAQLRTFAVYEETDQYLYNNFFSTAGSNNGQAGDPELDQLLLKARSAEGSDERRLIYEAIQRRLAGWLPMMPLISHGNGWYVGDKVGGFPGVRPGFNSADHRYLWAVR